MRAFGARRVTLRTHDGASFEGRIAQASLSDASVVLLFALEAAPDEPLVVTLDSIAAVEETVEQT